MNTKFFKQSFTVSALLALTHACCGPALAETQFQEQSDIGAQLKLPVHKWSNPDANPKAIIVAIQALIFDGKQWDAFAKHMSDKGYVVYAQDFRGYGDWLKENDFGGDKAYHFGQSKDDLTKLLTGLREKYPMQKIFCIGESIGANMAIWEAATDPKLFDGAIAIGLSNKHCRLLPKPHWVLTIAKGLSNRKAPFSLKPYMGVLTEDKKVTKDMVEDKKTITEISPTDLIKANITNHLSIEHVENIPADMPILIIAGENDRVQVTKSLDEVIQRMGSTCKEFVVLPKKGHLLLEHRPVDPDIARRIENWLDRQQSPTITNTTTAESQSI